MAPVIIVLGLTGAGKTTITKRLAESHNLVYIYGGDLLRSSGDPALVAALERGELAPTPVMERLLGQAIREVPADQGMVFDGSPRKHSELMWLEDQLKASGRVITRAFLLEVDPDLSLKRIEGRRPGDNQEALRVKLAWYQDEVAKVASSLEERGLLVRVDASKDLDTVYKEIEADL